jgi:hypothetical protein
LKFGNSNTKLYHTTAQIGPTQDYQQAIRLAIPLLHEMAKHDIECIGSLEYSDPKETATWQQFFAKKPFYAKLHKGEAHFHIITNQYFKKDDAIMRSTLFNFKDQLYQQIQGKGKYKDQSTAGFITKLIEYGRKRTRIARRHWFQSITDSDQQLSFKVEYGEVYLWDHGKEEWVEHRIRECNGVKLCDHNFSYRGRDEFVENVRKIEGESGGGLGSVGLKGKVNNLTSSRRGYALPSDPVDPTAKYYINKHGIITQAKRKRNVKTKRR